MAESESTARAASQDGGVEGGCGARAMMGDSLPPRKRLLAGLKQNGSWMSSSSAASAAAASGGNSPDAAAVAAGGGVGSTAETAGSVGGGATEAKMESAAAGEVKAKQQPGSGCLSCGAVESSAWRRVKRNGGVQRLCNPCALAFNKNMNCPHCLVVYPDVRDPIIWLQCTRCQRSVHAECEKRCSSSQPHAVGCPFICSECVQLKKHSGGNKEHGSEPLPHHQAVLGTNCVDGKNDEGNCGASGGTECASPGSKKLRLTRDMRGKFGDGEADGAVAGVYEGPHHHHHNHHHHHHSNNHSSSNLKSGSERKRTSASSQEAAAAAAAATAVAAGRAAAVAKASAAVKAAAAAKAAAVAKVALEAAADAARAEAQARNELRRNSTYWDHAGDSKPLHHKKERAAAAAAAAAMAAAAAEEKQPEVKIEVEEVPASSNRSSIDDEELARQLHRAINSSPRISSSLTPLRRKPSVTPSGTIIDTSHSSISWPRAGLSSAGEPRS